MIDHHGSGGRIAVAGKADWLHIGRKVVGLLLVRIGLLLIGIVAAESGDASPGALQLLQGPKQLLNAGHQLLNGVASLNLAQVGAIQLRGLPKPVRSLNARVVPAVGVVLPINSHALIIGLEQGADQPAEFKISEQVVGGNGKESNPPDPCESHAVLKTGGATGPHPLPSRPFGAVLPHS